MTTDQEDPAIAERAKRLYEQIAANRLDRTSIARSLSDAFDPRTLDIVSSQLASLGPPVWRYKGRAPGRQGTVSLYDLVTPRATVRLTIGIDDAGDVWAFTLSGT